MQLLVTTLMQHIFQLKWCFMQLVSTYVADLPTKYAVSCCNFSPPWHNLHACHVQGTLSCCFILSIGPFLLHPHVHTTCNFACVYHASQPNPRPPMTMRVTFDVHFTHPPKLLFHIINWLLSSPPTCLHNLQFFMCTSPTKIPVSNYIQICHYIPSWHNLHPPLLHINRFLSSPPPCPNNLQFCLNATTHMCSVHCACSAVLLQR